jgi:hypothetical protein
MRASPKEKISAFGAFAGYMVYRILQAFRSGDFYKYVTKRIHIQLNHPLTSFKIY